MDVPNAQDLMRVVGTSPRVMKVEAGARIERDSKAVSRARKSGVVSSGCGSC